MSWAKVIQEKKDTIQIPSIGPRKQRLKQMVSVIPVMMTGISSEMAQAETRNAMDIPMQIPFISKVIILVLLTTSTMQSQWNDENKHGWSNMVYFRLVFVLRQLHSTLTNLESSTDQLARQTVVAGWIMPSRPLDSVQKAACHSGRSRTPGAAVGERMVTSES
jgi:hypothetical protein